MAQRRMFSAAILEADNFIELPATAKSLYLYLALSADDDGGVNTIKTCMWHAGSGEEDLSLLEKNGYIIRFPSGVIFITHWRAMNTIQKDRYVPTQFQDEFAQLEITKAKQYH